MQQLEASSAPAFTIPGELLQSSSSGRPLEAPPTLLVVERQGRHFHVLPVLLLEFLALALTRAVLPPMLLQQYGNRTYLVLGCADCIRGLLAFGACPVSIAATFG